MLAEDTLKLDLSCPRFQNSQKAQTISPTTRLDNFSQALGQADKTTQSTRPVFGFQLRSNLPTQILKYGIQVDRTDHREASAIERTTHILGGTISAKRDQNIRLRCALLEVVTKARMSAPRRAKRISTQQFRLLMGLLYTSDPIRSSSLRRMELNIDTCI